MTRGLSASGAAPSLRSILPLLLVLAACGADGGTGGNPDVETGVEDGSVDAIEVAPDVAATDATAADDAVDAAADALPEAEDASIDDAADAGIGDASGDAADVAGPDDSADSLEVQDTFDAFEEADAPDAVDSFVPLPQHGPVFDPAGGDFLSIPFPSDSRRKADGTIDWTAFPDAGGVELIERYLGVASRLDGYSVAQVVYFAFNDPVDVSGLPEWIPAAADQPVQLVDVTPGPGLGRRVPLAWRWDADEDAFLPGRVLSIRPVPGATLAPGHAYAALVTSDLPASPALAAPAAFLDALQGNGPAGASLAPLAAWLSGEPALAARVVVATVFTVDDPLEDLRRIRAALWKLEALPPIHDVQWVSSKTDWDLYDAVYEAPEFLAGESPFATEGGGFAFDEAGEPVVQRTVTLRLALSVPRNREMPATGWPIALTAHGTGGDYHSFASSNKNAPATALARHGLAGTGIDQPLHGARGPAWLTDDLLDLYSFNFLNPDAGRTVQRQSVPDQVYLLRLLHAGGIVIPAAVSKRGVEERFDPAQALFFGHSQGGVTGALLFAVEDRLRGGVLSGAGGGLSTTIVQRKDPMDFRAVVAGSLGLDSPEDLTEFHPALALIQLIVDAVDPIAYGAGWRTYDATDPSAGPRSVLMTEGLLDVYTPSATAEALAAAGGLPVLEPYASWSQGAQALGILPVAPPVTGNLTDPGPPVTGVLAQYPNDGHFAVFDNATAFTTYGDFLGTLTTGPGTVDAPQ